jgi:hypothetical protein
MLVIGRKRDEKIIIDGNIEITVLKVGRNHVKFGVNAPRHVRIQTRTDPSEASPVPVAEQTRATPIRKEGSAAAAGKSSPPSVPSSAD